jgi:hypothetical protein
MFSISCANGITIVTNSTSLLRMNRGGRTGFSSSIHLVVVVAQMGRQNVLAGIVVVVAIVTIVMVLRRITITTMTVMAAEESALHIPEVPLMILGQNLMTIIQLIATIVGLRRLGWMRVNAGLVVLHVLLLPHLQGGPLAVVVAMMPIICLVMAIGSLDSSCLGG